jgi:hypothetical protein
VEGHLHPIQDWKDEKQGKRLRKECGFPSDAFSAIVQGNEVLAKPYNLLKKEFVQQKQLFL